MKGISRCLAICCLSRPKKTEPKKILQVSSTMHLDTYGQISRNRTSKTKKRAGKMTKNTNHAAKQKANKEQSKLALPAKKLQTSVAPKQQAAKKNNKKPPVQKHTIAIQAGSPLSKTRSRKTKTILSFSKENVKTTDKSSLRKSNNQTDGNKKGEVAKTSLLRPLKKDPLLKNVNIAKKRDATLEPINIEIPKKLVPVDKDFLKRLEYEAEAKENKYDNNYKKRGKRDVSRHVKAESPQSKRTSQEIQVSSSTTFPQTTQVSFQEMETATSDGCVYEDDDLPKARRRQTEDGPYDSDDLDLIDEIEKEFGFI
jgi:hypothetical protein